MHSYHRHILFWGVLGILMSLTLMGCSTQKNTAQSRWWHAFNARYNTYYNGTLAYIDGSLEKENGNKDNYTEQIPLYTVSNKNSRELGKSNFDRAIEKSEKAIQQHSIKKRPVWNKSRRKTAQDLEWLHRKEYNPFLWKAWMLMGRSQFFQGDFESAASTFSYMSRLYSTQPAIYGKARAWLAKCYTEMGLTYDAEDVIRNMERDSIHWRAQKEWDYAYADYYIHQGEAAKAIPYLRKVISHEMRRKQKAREWYLMGQLQASIGNKQEAYRAFKHVINLNPPYELAFNARISITEVLAKDNAKKMIGKLKRMAASDNNKEYQDQIFYALGNIYLAQQDTLCAIAAYEQGNHRAQRNGIEKGVLLLHLGNLYWNQDKYPDAKRCYGEAIGLLDQDRKDYQQLSHRSKVLDELVPYTEAVALQDSLQSLALMSEKERNAAIDRVINALKKKEKEERNKQAEQEAKQKEAKGESHAWNQAYQPRVNMQGNQGNAGSTLSSIGGNEQWYFYSPLAVSQGKAQFQKIWGKRENVDNWQRSNQTVVVTAPKESTSEEPNAAPTAVAAPNNQLQQTTDSASNDPHKRAYYLAQIPFSAEQVAQSNKVIEDGLYHAGVIFKDQLDNLSLSEKMLTRLVNQYPDYEHMDDAYYHLYLLYSRKHQPAVAHQYLQKLQAGFPESQWTALLTNPYYEENARFGVHIEDSLYADTYEAFKASIYNKVKENRLISDQRFPDGANRDKFLFIGGLSKLNEGDVASCLSDMKQVTEKYPKSRLSEMAGMIINGVNAGRHLYGGKFDLSEVWTRRSEVLNATDSTQIKNFTAERNEKFIFLFAYAPDSVNENQLLFEVAKYNFTSYLARHFDLQIEEVDGLHRLQISGFQNYDEARQYANAIYQQAAITHQAAKARGIIISESNLPLLGKTLSYDDYAKFYTKSFAPLKIKKEILLYEPEEETPKAPAETPAEEKQNTEQPATEDNTDTGIDFDDNKTPADLDLNDEYYDLDGF